MTPFYALLITDAAIGGAATFLAVTGVLTIRKPPPRPGPRKDPP